MIAIDPLSSPVAFHLGPVVVSEAVVTTWGLMAVLVGGSFLSTRRLHVHPGRWQAFLELVITSIAGQIGNAIRQPSARLLPLVATLFLFLATANLSMQIPGVSAPTARLETDAALALIVFLAVHGHGIRHHGLAGYLAHYLRPYPILAPLHVLSELTRTLSLTVRLFGNLMSHEIVVGIVLALAGLFVPIPIMALGVLVGLVQAYIFTVLATVYLGAAIEITDQTEKG